MGPAVIHVAVKVLFTGGLLLVVALCGAEIWRLWWDDTLVLSSFEYHRDGAEVAEAGQRFTRLIEQDLKLLEGIHSRQPATRPARPVTPPGPELPSPDHGRQSVFGRVDPDDNPFRLGEQSIFSSVEIEVSGIAISNIVRQLGHWIRRPHSLTGSVTEVSSRLEVYGELRNMGLENDDEDEGDHWHIVDQPDMNVASFALSSRVYHRLLVGQDSLYRRIASSEFYAYSRALRMYRVYLERLAELATEEEANKALAEAGGLITRLYARGQTFPYIQKLAGYVFFAQKDFRGAERALTEYLDLAEELEETDEDAKALLAEAQSRIAEPQLAVLETAEELKLRARAPRDQPLRPGLSVGTATGGSGTLCCIVEDPSGRPYLMSSEHVFVGNVGDVVIQPGVSDGGEESDRVAEISRVLMPDPSRENYVAGALARVDEGLQVTNEIPGFGRIKGISTRVRLGDSVWMVGRTSGKTEGIVQTVDFSLRISLREGAVRFGQLIVTSPLSDAGDSGAPVLNSRGQLIGFLYAGSTEISIIVPIGPVLDEFGVTLLREE